MIEFNKDVVKWSEFNKDVVKWLNPIKMLWNDQIQ